MIKKYGVGVTTTPKRVMSSNFTDNLSEDSELFIGVDTDFEGVSINRNKVIKSLYDKGYEYIFLMDDDCYPVKKGWEEYFVKCHIESGIHHFGLPETFKSIVNSVSGSLTYYDSSIGCFHFMTRKLIETIGYFNTKYEKYGYEDVGFKFRAVKSGLGAKEDGYPSPSESHHYIHSEDVHGEHPTPNYSFDEKAKFIKNNEEEFKREMFSGKLFYPHK